jgi:putative transposase
VTFVEAHRHTFGVAPLLAAIGEPVSTFYDRISREPSRRAVADAALAERIEAIWERSRRSYGAPRIHAMLAREGIRVGRKRVGRLMRQLGIQGAHLHKHWKTTRQNKQASAAPDLVDRNFTAAVPNMLWVADLTYIKTLQGILYLAVVLDVFSRKVVGWQMADRMTTDLVLSALEMGLWRREVVRNRLIHHSDKGSQYTSLRFTQRLADAGIAPSTGSVGDSFDHAVAESFFGTLKTELIYRHTWASRHDAELAIFTWIEGWYNPERIMTGLGMCSPDEYEAAFYADTTNANLDTIVKVGNHLSSLQESGGPSTGCVVETGKHGRRWLHPDPGGGKLDGQRQAIQPAAVLRNGPAILAGQLESRSGCLRALHEQSHPAKRRRSASRGTPAVLPAASAAARRGTRALR